VKYCFYSLLWTGLALAQSDTTLYPTDINGRQVPEATYLSKDGDYTALTQSINGRQVPMQKSDLHVLSETPTRKVTETIVRKYDGNGQVVSTERIVSDEQKRPGGSTTKATIYRSDVNGTMQESERRTIDTQKQGDTTTSSVTISRPGLSGSFEPAEKRDVVTTVSGDTTHEVENIYRPSQSGQFVEAARHITEETKTPTKTTSTTANYEVDYTGKVSLASQEVSKTIKAANGTQVTTLDLYGLAPYGVARSPQDGMKLKEQQTIVRQEGPGGAVTESTNVARPTLADPTRLGPSQVISETVCTGKCGDQAKP
jgi:hypothetical protein